MSMPLPTFTWGSVDSFENRDAELARMQLWWESGTPQPLAILGRRRVGKSWLFRRFAHTKPALILVAEQLPLQTQLNRFARDLTEVLGFTPQLTSIGDLVRALYRAASDDALLVVIDEFPYLLGASHTEAVAAASELQAAMEAERDSSHLRLIVCGSQVSQMESLFGEGNPLHGRLERLEVRPLPYSAAHGLLGGLDDPVERFERYSVCGGMPLYLSRLGTGDLRNVVCQEVLDPLAPLWDEGRIVVEQELREPRVYLALLERLAGAPQQINELAQHAGLDSARASKYMATLADLRLVSRIIPVGAVRDSRDGRWRLEDPFLRFWYRFVFPNQSDLEGGVDLGVLFDTAVAPHLADHCAPVFEEWALRWLRSTHSEVAVNWGRWWGRAANTYRRSGERSTEEIDAVGIQRNRVAAVAECKWTNKALTPTIVTDLERYKIPALADAGMKVAGRPKLILACRSGYTEDLVTMAADRDDIELVDVAAALST